VSSIHILDTSAILALIQHEKGAALVESALEADDCWMTTVNMCEVLGKLCEKGATLEDALVEFGHFGISVKVFDEDLAERAASLRTTTRPIGASLGDRACLALAQQACRAGDTPVVYTAEQAWAKLEWPFRIVRIRCPRRRT
jgi:ribonuclease VapC